MFVRYRLLQWRLQYHVFCAFVYTPIATGGHVDASRFDSERSFLKLDIAPFVSTDVSRDAFYVHSVICSF